jgi:hypothetical protein
MLPEIKNVALFVSSFIKVPRPQHLTVNCALFNNTVKQIDIQTKEHYQTDRQQKNIYIRNIQFDHGRTVMDEGHKFISY